MKLQVSFENFYYCRELFPKPVLKKITCGKWDCERLQITSFGMFYCKTEFPVYLRAHKLFDTSRVEIDSPRLTDQICSECAARLMQQLQMEKKEAMVVDEL